MAALTAKEILEATGGTMISMGTGISSYERGFKGVSINSRTISDGEVFFALKGERFNGHDFVKDALLKGGGAVIDSKAEGLPEGKIIIYVQDTLKALQDLAHFLRMRRDIPVIAITGSNGKTTTKEMTYTILSKRFKVLRNEGNLNNHIGLPLSLTRIEPDDEVIVLELGMNAAGEIRRLCEIAEPSHGIITNIGSAHIGRLGGLDSIRNAKLEILQGLSVIILNADDGFLMQGYEELRRKTGFRGRLITFSINPVRKDMRGFFSNGVNNDSDVKAENLIVTDNGSSFTLNAGGTGSIDISLNLQGVFNVYNALAASAVSLSLGISLAELKSALEGYRAFPMRFEVIRGEEITLINDSYNANPSSVEESLKELVRIRGLRRVVAVLGDMFELGEFAEDAHKAVGRMVSQLGIDVFIAVGEMMRIAADECRRVSKQAGRNYTYPEIYAFNSADEGSQHIAGILKAGDMVLVKGSRAMWMEKIAEGVKELDNVI